MNNKIMLNDIEIKISELKEKEIDESVPFHWKEVASLIDLLDTISNHLNKVEETLNKLPHTRDGVPIVPGLRVYFNSYDSKSSTEGYTIDELEIWKKYCHFSFNGTAFHVEDYTKNNSENDYMLHDQTNWAFPNDFGLYAYKENLPKPKSKPKKEKK